MVLGRITSLAFVLFSVLGLTALAAEPATAVRTTVERFVHAQFAGMAGRVAVRVQAPAEVPPGACTRMEAFLPAGARLWGAVNVGVRCTGGAQWTLFVPVVVSIHAPVVVAARPLAQGKTLTADDLTLATREISALPAGVLTDPGQALGQVLNVGLLPGHAVRQDMLRPPLVVRQGQSVRLVVKTGGLEVSNEGKALANAAAGQSVQVRTPVGQVITGVARPDGSVEVPF